MSLFVGGVAAVILELAEPGVRTGVWEHSSFRSDPVRRQQRTGLAGMVTVYGARSVAEVMMAGVVRMHETVSARSADRSADAWRQALQPIVSLNADITRVMDQAWRQMTGFGMMGGLRPAEPVAANGWAALFGAPPADLVETEKAYTLRIEVPGLKREDVDILLKDEALLVSGQKVETREEGPGAYRLSERRYGRFERLVPLPQDVDPQTVEADLQDGVLTISLPKTEAASQAWRRIEIN